jgi:chemotaxis signal transduction protein
MNARGFLVVRAGTRRVGLALENLVEVLEPPAAMRVPSAEPALRGVIPVRDALLPLVSLDALLSGTACGGAPADAAVLVQVGEVRFCLEVDAAESVAHEATLPVPTDAAMPWAEGIALRPDGHIPLLDLGAIGSRLAEASA